MSNINKAVPGVDQFYPLQDPPVGTAYSDTIFPKNANLPILFQPLTIRGITFKNRIFVAPMCQYSADNGHATDWHLVHIGAFATRGFAGALIEATAVVPEGRISPEDMGLWTDSQIAPLQRITKFAHIHDMPLGIQLAHAGRKASTLAPWVERDVAKTRYAGKAMAGENENGWPDNVYAPSKIPFDDGYPMPKEMTLDDMQYVEDAFVAAVERSKKAGFDFIEVHAAHGYLLSEFLSPLSNTRTDSYGGQLLENRMRFPLRLIKRVREAWPDKPLFVRYSATEWAEGPEKGDDGLWRSWGIKQSKIFSGELKKLGVDLIHISSGGNWAKQNIDPSRDYQVNLAEAIKKSHPDVVVGAVGKITKGDQAESYLQDKKADVVFLAKEAMRDPSFVLRSAQEMQVAVSATNQYERAWDTMLRRTNVSRGRL